MPTPETSSPETRARKNTWRHFDVASGVAFIVGGLMSMGGIINNIHKKFYHAHVLGYGETPTIFTPIVKDYLGDYHKGAANTQGKFYDLHQQLIAVDSNTTLSAEDRLAQSQKIMNEMKKMGRTFRDEIEKKMETSLGIRSDGIHRWTDGAWKKFRHLGITANREAALGIAATSAVGIGAMFLLRSQNHALNSLDDKLDALQEKTSRDR